MKYTLNPEEKAARNMAKMTKVVLNAETEYNILSLVDSNFKWQVEISICYFNNFLIKL